MSGHIKSEIRKDYIQDKYVIIAPRRNLRPHTSDINYDQHSRHVNINPKDCAFCKANISLKPATVVVGTKKDWQMIVLPNKYPAVSLTNRKAYGLQEVIIETPRHGMELENFSESRICRLLDLYAERTETLMANPKIEYILIFKNNGGRAGASIQHSHSQLFAMGFIPPHLIDKSQRVQTYRLKTGRCVYCDVISKESKSSRLIYLDDNIIAFCPYASLYNYEVWIMPRRHFDNVTGLNTKEKLAIATTLKKVVGKITHQLNLPYNYYFHQVVHEENEHLYIKITPRGSVWAGVEVGSGIIINPVFPEQAAAFYRKK